jgi:SulP family sulfate permease
VTSAPASSDVRRTWIFPSFRGYQRDWISRDVIAGLTLWAVLVPESLAYATIAGVSPVVGLYAVPPALLLYAAFGSSKHLIVGPGAATAALSAAAVADLATGGPANFAAFTATIAIVTGVLALLAGLFRLGFVANFIAEPVLKGFIIGLALTIIVGQLPKIFGFEKEGENFFEQLWNFILHLNETEWRTLTVGALSFAIVIGLRKFAPKVPAALVAVAFGIAVVKIFNLDQHGVAIVGPIQSGLPSIQFPHDLSLSDYFATSASAVGIMLVGFAEGLAAAKNYATLNHYEIDANRELIGLGAANIGAGLCQGMVVSGGLSKTAVNASGGARSQLSSIAAAAVTVITLVFLTGLFENLPEATLGAVVIAALIELVDIQALVKLYRLSTRRLGNIYGVAARPDFIAALAAMFGVLIFDTLPGLFIGITVSILLLVYRASHPHIATLGQVAGTRQYSDVDRHPENAIIPGVAIVRVEGPLFFANAEGIASSLTAIAQEPGTQTVILDTESIPFVDISAVHALATASRNLEAAGVRLVLAHDIGQVEDLFRVAHAEELIDDLYPTVQAAVDAVT